MRIPVLGAVALATACVLFAPRPAQAWHENGHMAVALIAYRQLDVTEQKKVQDVLKNHPHFAVFLSAEMPSDAQPDEWVVMRAAVWPDWVRNPKSAGAEATSIRSEFSQPDWHFVNLAIKSVPANTPQGIKDKIDANSAKPKGEALKRLQDLSDGWKNQNGISLPALVSSSPKPTVNDAEAKAVALCWLLHLVGDLHQPLHAAAFFSPESVAGDHGGNAFMVRLGNRVLDLHSLWDGAFGWDELKAPHSSQYALINGLSRNLLSRNKPSQQQKDEMKFQTWADESLELAKTKAYFPQGTLIPGVFVGPHEHKPHATDLDKLPDGYGNVVEKVAEERATLAGFRLGGVLKDLVKP